MAEQRNEGILLCFVCRLRLNYEVGSCNIRIQLAVERRSFAIRENAFRLLVYMPKLKEGDTTPDPQTRCNGFVEGMAYKRENWAPVCNESSVSRGSLRGGEGKSRGAATGFSGSLSSRASRTSFTSTTSETSRWTPGKEIAFDLRKGPPSGYTPLLPPPEVLENVQNLTGVTPAQATSAI